MFEQIQSAPTDGSNPVAPNGKTGKAGKQGVFTNLFKALAQKGITAATQGKAGKAVLLTPASAADSAHASVITAKGNAALAGKGTVIRKEAKEPNLAAKSAKPAMQKAGGKEQVIEWNPLATASATAATTVLTQQAGAGKALGKETDETTTQEKLTKQSGRNLKGGAEQHASQLVKSDMQEKNTLSHKSAEARLTQSGTTHARAAQTNPTPQATEQVSDGPSRLSASTTKQGSLQSSVDAKASGHHSPVFSATGIDNMDQAKLATGQTQTAAGIERAANIRIAMHVTSQNVHHASVGNPDDSAANIAALLKDVEAQQNLKATLNGKSGGKTHAAGIAGTRNNDPSQSNMAAQVSIGGQSHSNTVGGPQNIVAQAVQANASAAIMADTGHTASGGQSNGQESGARQEGTEGRFTTALQNEGRPQQAFDLQARAASRMAHPMPALDAMQQIALSAKNGTTRLELQLEPAHLGKVHISLQTDATKQLQMHLTVENAMSRQVIEQHMPALRAALEQQGLSLDNFSLQTGTQDQQQQHAFEFAAGAEKNSTDYANGIGSDNATATPQAFASSRLSIHI